MTLSFQALYTTMTWMIENLRRDVFKLFTQEKTRRSSLQLLHYSQRVFSFYTRWPS